MRIVKNNKYIIIYYAVLLLIMAIRTGVDAPNALLRLGYLVAFLFPLIIKYTNMYLPCIITFMTVCTYNYAFGYLPYELSIYFLISLVSLVFVIGRQSLPAIHLSPIFLFTLYYVAVVNILYSGEPQDIFYGMATVGIGIILLGENRKLNRYNLLNCFTIISLTLSCIYLINYEQFLESYNSADSIDRSGWTDPNYLSCIVGMGVVTSLILLLKERNARFILRLMWCSTIVLSFVAQVLMASRGGLLCVCVASMILIFFANVKFKYKLLITILLLALLVFLYSNNFFELLIYRVNNDTVGGGSGRIDIWKLKIREFITEGNICQWIFGIGYESAFRLGFGPSGFGFHNDFLAILCGYGLVGCIVFCYLLFIYPFRRIKSEKAIVFSMIIYLALACMTLEPISVGRLPYMGFYALIIVYANTEIK